MNEAERASVTLPSTEEILVTRTFSAPKNVVYEAWTRPELVRLWWSGHRGTMTIAEIDLRVGGRWRYAMVSHAGEEVTFSGEYREIVPERRIVYTEMRGAEPGASAQTTVTFTEADGATTVAIRVRYETRHDRDAHHQYMADGLHDALDLLERVCEREESA